MRSFFLYLSQVSRLQLIIIQKMNNINMKKLFIIILAVTLYSCVNSAKIDGLTDEVEVLRDNFGINHI